MTVKRDITVGIDPGLKGAIAFVRGERVMTYDMPTKLVKFKGKNKRVIDAQGIVDLIKPHAHRIKVVAIEKVGVMTGTESRSAMFNFGYGAGIIEGIVRSFDLQFIKLNPAVWKPLLGLSRSKTASIVKACTIFYQDSSQFKNKSDGRAEAALIGHIVERDL